MIDLNAIIQEIRKGFAAGHTKALQDERAKGYKDGYAIGYDAGHIDARDQGDNG